MLIIKSGFFHWFFQRNTAILLIIIAIVLNFINSIILNSFFLVCICMHLRLGFETLVNDYIHDSIFKLLGLTFIRLLTIFLLKFLLLSIIF